MSLFNHEGRKGAGTLCRFCVSLLSDSGGGPAIGLAEKLARSSPEPVRVVQLPQLVGPIFFFF